MAGALSLVVAVVVAWSAPRAVAPGPADLDAAFADVEAALDDAEAIARAVARVHNTWADPVAAGASPECDSGARRAVPERARVLLQAHRDAAQSAHVRARRLNKIASDATLAAVMDRGRLDRVAAALARADAQRAWYLELLVWHRRYLARPPVSCGTELAAAPGFRATLGDDASRPVAIIGVGDGWICPAREPASSGVVVVAGRACYGDAGCGCVPEPVLPGAVLGP